MAGVTSLNTAVDGYLDWLPAVYWAGPPMADRVEDVDPTQSYLGVDSFDDLRQLPQVPDDLTAVVGPRAYDAIYRDGVVRSSIRTARGGAVGGGPTLSPRHPHPSGLAIDWRDPPEDATPDQVDSAKALAACLWLNQGLRTPIEEVCWQLSGAFVWQNKLAEKVFEYSSDFDGRARLVPRDVRAKGWALWWFVLDRTNNLDSILCRDPESTGRYLRIPPDKFVLSAFGREDDSPVGVSVQEPCHTWWKLKYQVPANVNKFVKLYSNLIPYVELGPNDKAEIPRDSLGRPIAGAQPVPPEARAAAVVSNLASGRGAVIPAGAKIGKLESSNNAEPFREVTDLCDRQMVHAILGSARATMEAAHNSKADSETGENVSDVVKDLIRLCVAAALYRGLYRDFLARNWGPDWADRHCPVVSFGQSQRHDFATASRAVSDLARAGILKESQFQVALRVILGLDLPEPEEGEAADVAPTPDDEDRENPGKTGEIGEE